MPSKQHDNMKIKVKQYLEQLGFNATLEDTKRIRSHNYRADVYATKGYKRIWIEVGIVHNQEQKLSDLKNWVRKGKGVNILIHIPYGFNVINTINEALGVEITEISPKPQIKPQIFHKPEIEPKLEPLLPDGITPSLILKTYKRHMGIKRPIKYNDLSPCWIIKQGIRIIQNKYDEIPHEYL